MSDYFSSSDDDLEQLLELNERPKNKNYFEETVPLFNDEMYRQHFRISRENTTFIAERYENSEYFHRQTGDSTKISALKFITVFLWYAGNESVSFRDVADRFDISKSSLHKIIRRVTYFLSNLSREIITWPTGEEKNEIERHFRNNNFPGVVGIIDGTHIRIDKPSEDSDSYLNRKHFYSIQAQIVCDHRRRIRDIFVGYPGSVHDSRVLRSSPLFETLPQKCQDLFILGDSGYPCLKNLMVPFKDRGQLTRRQRNYNFLLSKNRYIVEHCFGILKQRFRQLYHIKLHNVRDIVHFIRACAVLHNIALLDNFAVNGNELPPNEVHNRNQNEERNEEDEDDINGVNRRNEIMNNLHFVL